MSIFTVKGEKYTIFDKLFNTADYIIATKGKFPIIETQEEALAFCRDLCSSMQNCSEEFKEARAIEFARSNYPHLFNNDAEVANHPTEDEDIDAKTMAEDFNKETLKAVTTPAEGKKESKDSKNTSSEKSTKVEKKENKNISSDKVENKNPSDGSTNMAKIDFGLGVAFDPDAINRAFEEEAQVHAQTVNPQVFQPQPFVAPPASMMFQPQMPQAPQAVQPPMMPNIAGWPSMTGGMPQQQPAMMPQQPVMPVQPQMMQVQPPMAPPIHRVDEPPKPVVKPQAPQVDGVEVDLGKVNIDGLMAPPEVVQTPGFIQKLQQIPAQAAPVAKEPIKENIADNREIIAKFPKIPLAEIEAIANQNGCNVAFQESPAPGIISVITFEAINGKHMTINPKCFCIDTGMIIDKRLKLIDVCPLINTNPNSVIPLECGEFYELRTVNIKDHNRKVLDRQLINDIFYAGTASITKKPMYSTAFKDLNKMVSLISIPTRNINAEQRNSIQNFLLNKLMGEGYLEKAISMAPGSRFEFVTSKIDKDHLGSFTLTNEGVPAFYGAMQMPVNPIIIEVVDGKVSIKSNGDKPDGAGRAATYMQPGNPPVLDTCTDPNCACHG